jgi:transcriptional regulator with XRE-family HTH domain
MSESTPSLGAWLRTQRGDRPQGAVAAELVDVGGCQQSNLSKFERDEAIPDAGQLEAICDVLSVPDEERREGHQIAKRTRMALHAERVRAADQSTPDAAA